MPEKTMRDAINEALHQAMEHDDSVFVIGRRTSRAAAAAPGDVGAVGGVFGVTEVFTTAGQTGVLIPQSPSQPS